MCKVVALTGGGLPPLFFVAGPRELSVEQKVEEAEAEAEEEAEEE